MESKLTHPRVTKPINSLKQLHKRHEFIRSLKTGLLEESAGQPKQHVDAKIDFLESTVDELLATSDALEADDARALFEILNAQQWRSNYLHR